MNSSNLSQFCLKFAESFQKLKALKNTRIDLEEENITLAEKIEIEKIEIIKREKKLQIDLDILSKKSENFSMISIEEKAFKLKFENEIDLKKKSILKLKARELDLRHKLEKETNHKMAFEKQLIFLKKKGYKKNKQLQLIENEEQNIISKYDENNEILNKENQDLFNSEEEFNKQNNLKEKKEKFEKQILNEHREKLKIFREISKKIDNIKKENERKNIDLESKIQRLCILMNNSQKNSARFDEVQNLIIKMKMKEDENEKIKRENYNLKKRILLHCSTDHFQKNILNNNCEVKILYFSA